MSHPHLYIGVKYKSLHQPLKMTLSSEVRIRDSRKHKYLLLLLFYNGDIFYNAIFIVIITILYHIVVLYWQLLSHSVL